MEKVFGVQCQALAEGGIDFFLLETFASLQQLIAAVRAARATALPVCASMAFLEGGRSGDGTSVEAFCAAMEKSDVDMLGANCGAGPLELLKVVKRLAGLTRSRLRPMPTVVSPNIMMAATSTGPHLITLPPWPGKWLRLVST